MLASLRGVQRRAYVAATVGVKAETLLRRGDADVPLYFTGSRGGIISPWHDIPLAGGSEPNVFNFVCEIPRGTTPKFEIATGKEWNPITQDRTAAGTPRYYALESIVNYGALPQTYEDPAVTDARTGLAGDGDPLDVCEIGIAKPATTGSVYAVKVLGALGLIDGGETDWKILAVRTTDPIAQQVSDCAHAPASVRLIMEDLRQWFKVYKVPEGKGENDFACNGKWLSAADALDIIHECHGQWKKLKDTSLANATSVLKPVYGEAAALATLKEQPWVSTGSSSEALRGRRANAVEVDLATMRVAQPLA